MPQDFQQESVFNMALAYLKRIDKLLYLCQHSASIGDVNTWTNNLRGVYREVSVKLDDIERKDILGSEKVIDFKTLTDDKITEDESNFKCIYYLINNNAFKNRYKRTIMFLLDGLEVKLRCKLQEKGMLLPSKQDPTKAVLQM